MALGRWRMRANVARLNHETGLYASGLCIPRRQKWVFLGVGGALAMKTYGHLRDEHSVSMAKKVKSAAAPQGKETMGANEAASSSPVG